MVRFIKGIGHSGTCTVTGKRWQAPAHLAALANGTMAHAFELDD